MAPKKQPWCRLYTETFTDLKIRRLKIEHRWLWVAVLGATKTSPKPGYLMLTDDDPWTADDLADFAAMPVKVVIAGMAQFERMGMVSIESGCWLVTKWAERQFQSDDVSTRVQKHRSNADVTANGTFQEAPCNAPDTEADTETETEVGGPTEKPSTRSTRAPDIFPLTDEITSWAEKAGITVPLRPEVDKFLDYHRAKGTTFKSWPAGFRTWMRNAQSFAERDGRLATEGPRETAASERW